MTKTEMFFKGISPNKSANKQARDLIMSQISQGVKSNMTIPNRTPNKRNTVAKPSKEVKQWNGSQ